MSVTIERMKEIEADFREWAFHLYYRTSFASETDNTLRFAKALAASCAPIRDHRMLLKWQEQREHEKAKKKAKRLAAIGA